MSKKYPSLKQEYINLLDNLESNPTLGTPIGNECYKIRLAIRSKGSGKRGGARIITCVKIINERIYLLPIYDKSELENISDTAIKYLLDSTGL